MKKAKLQNNMDSVVSFMLKEKENHKSPAKPSLNLQCSEKQMLLKGPRGWPYGAGLL